MPELPDVRYPIGPRPTLPAEARTPQQLRQFIAAFEHTEAAWHALIEGAPDASLDRPYREGGWNARQLVHHTADAHAHGLNRLKYGLTQEEYQIQPFDPEAWMALPDMHLPVRDALALLHVANVRWLALLRAVNPQTLTRELTHPTEGRQDLWQLIAKHDWHARHHLAQARVAVEGNS
ncbi:DinB family protein [Deinococcus maricopensis]|uniref:DinB-like domain-containing protein n=1 Tax=Deinococcus maricopensis (strain DSM 21211 / LMG 22137 / NRRL B-23946 / LB-34) TaxID=709986 RepID=E8UB87_DEIML|nr:DinB family protein [Deinococcus maricopensis]ADV68326.1 hypothetical protein Deima_2695 [Deinococcus maricopensis DSM 21211]